MEDRVQRRHLIKTFSLLDLANAKQLSCSQVPESADASQAYAYLDYDAGTGELPPVAVASASPTTGNISLLVSFDGTASYDQTGAIASYAWDFGDGAAGSGPTSQHIYGRAGTFNAKLTVTDSYGSQSSSAVTITAIDPNVINAPSGLAASVSGRTVTLSWTDNSTNETGFSIERGLKGSKGTISFVQVGSAPTGATTYSETVASGTYYYRVRAINTSTGIASGYSNNVSVRVR